jgi:hypothetical protein
MAKSTGIRDYRTFWKDRIMPIIFLLITEKSGVERIGCFKV